MGSFVRDLSENTAVPCQLLLKAKIMKGSSLIGPGVGDQGWGCQR